MFLLCPREFPGSSVGKELACSAGDLGSIPGLGRSPEGGNGNPLQYSCMENPIERGVWRATVHGVTRVRHDLATKPTTMPKDEVSDWSQRDAILASADVILSLFIGAQRREKMTKTVPCFSGLGPPLLPGAGRPS